MKKLGLTIGLSLLAYVAYSSTKKTKRMPEFHPIVPNQKGRGCDPLGCGHFGAPRGNRDHEGYDITIHKGQAIQSPITGTMKRISKPYSSDLFWNGLILKNDTYEVILWYFSPSIAKGDFVFAGDVIGVAQDVSEKHGSAMTPHIHVQAYKNGVLVDPEPLFR